MPVVNETSEPEQPPKGVTPFPPLRDINVKATIRSTASERRRHPKDRFTITQILSQMQELADKHYDGDLQNNTMTIFNLLSRDSKRTFLRRSLLTLWETQIDLARSGLQEVVVEFDLRIRPDEVEKERQSIEQFSQIEQVRLRSKMQMLAFWVLIGFALFVVSFLLFSSPTGGAADAPAISQRISKVVGYAMQYITK